MTCSTELQVAYEDPLTYLPRKPLQEFGRQRVIYDRQHPCAGLYVVIAGRVKVTSTANDGCETIGRIVSSDGLFGESALVGAQPRADSAVAIDPSSLMCWTRGEIEQQIEREPRLGLALTQFLVMQCIALQDRVESMSVHKTPQRVMLALLQLAGTMGAPTDDGATRIGSLTHQTIAEYVGTSREIVTFQMNRLRRMGLLKYSRKSIDIYEPAMRQALREHDINATPPSNLIAGRLAAHARLD